MATPALVLIDTCIWVSFFNRPHSPVALAVGELLDDNRGAMLGPIVAEVLIGFRRDEQADWVASVLKGLHYFELSWEDWRSAAALGRHLASAGHVLPLSDLAVAAVALKQNAEVYSTDPHFDLFPHLRRFVP